MVSTMWLKKSYFDSSFWRRRFGPGIALDTGGLADDLLDGLEARAHWDRVGL